jgi:hypothetical protein
VPRLNHDVAQMECEFAKVCHADKLDKAGSSSISLNLP